MDCIQLSYTQSRPIEINGLKLLMVINFNQSDLSMTNFGYKEAGGAVV